MSRDFIDTMSQSSLSTLSSLDTVATSNASGCSRCAFGSPGEPCSWLMPVIIGLGLILLVVLVYYWCNGNEYHRRRRRPIVRETDIVIIDQQPQEQQPQEAVNVGAVMKPVLKKPKSSGQVEDLTAEMLDAKIKGGDEFVVAVISDGCGWCHRLMPELVKAAKMVDIPIYSIRVQVARDIAQRHNISGFPHILHFKNGKPINQHPGFAPLDGLLAFINSKKNQ